MKLVDVKNYAIVADIGGTFARFARVDLDNLQMDFLQVYTCSDFISLQSAFLSYKAHYDLSDVKQFAVAIACPVLGDEVSMTNGKWSFSIGKTKDELGLDKLVVINDFSAVAQSLPFLREKDLVQIGQGEPIDQGVKAVLGAGTGLGVSYLISSSGQSIAFSGEGGHVSWGATNELEWIVYQFLNKRFNHVSYERVLSGQGLENIYAALADYRNQAPIHKTAKQITEDLALGQNELSKEAVNLFFSCLGAYAGNLALVLGAFGGVYIAGGVVPRLLTTMQQSDFRNKFESKGRFSDFNKSIPTYVITANQPGILGAATRLRHL